MPTPSPIIVASVVATVGTAVAWPMAVMSARVVSSPRIAVTIGSAIAVTVPNASTRITTAAAMPIASLLSVDGRDSFWPTYPPTAGSSPALAAGSAASRMSWASVVVVPPDPMSSVTEM